MSPDFGGHIGKAIVMAKKLCWKIRFFGGILKRNYKVLTKLVIDDTRKTLRQTIKQQVGEGNAVALFILALSELMMG
ncbi:MAG TPA: hypothetical protein PKD37_05285 [Oligoflexia bacterium]|nr:hypothetical protein [Oligoflexia bacterium]HMP27380.1 hypothetical protein [Oligoflexia bacterium]